MSTPSTTSAKSAKFFAHLLVWFIIIIPLPIGIWIISHNALLFLIASTIIGVLIGVLQIVFTVVNVKVIHAGYKWCIDHIANFLLLIPWKILTIIALCLLIVPGVGVGIIRLVPPAHQLCYQENILSWSWPCGQALGYTNSTIQTPFNYGEQNIKIGVIDSIGDAPLDISGGESDLSIDQKIFAENQSIGKAPYITLAVVTMLGRNANDNTISINVGLEDLKGAYLYQKLYNATHTIKIKLVIGNIGTSTDYQESIPQIMNRLALLAKQDQTFRGIIGLPFSSQTFALVDARKTLGFEDVLPIISPSSTSEHLENVPNFYHIPPSDHVQACVLYDFIAQQLAPAIGLQHDLTKKTTVTLGILQQAGDNYSLSLASSLTAISSEHSACADYSNESGNIQIVARNPVSYDSTQTNFQNQANFQQQLRQLISQNDLLFYSGYAYNLPAIEQTLANMPIKKKVYIVGGDGSFASLGRENQYTTLFSTMLVTPLQVNDPFAQAYIRTFGRDKIATTTDHNVLVPPHAIQTYEAVEAFANVLPEQGGVPSQKDFDAALTTQQFTGINNDFIHFDRDNTNGSPQKGPSEPFNRPVFVMCVSKNGQPNLAATYIPGNIPSKTQNLTGNALLDCP